MADNEEKAMLIRHISSINCTIDNCDQTYS